MEINFYTIVWTVINISILFLLLSKWLFKPVKEFMDSRTKAIEDDINNAEVLKADAQKLKENYDLKLKDIENEKVQILIEAKKKGDKIFDQRVDEAANEAERIKERERREIELERSQMVDDLKKSTVNIALDAASKVLSEELNPEKHQKLIAGFIEDLK